MRKIQNFKKFELSSSLTNQIYGGQKVHTSYTDFEENCFTDTQTFIFGILVKVKVSPC